MKQKKIASEKAIAARVEVPKTESVALSNAEVAAEVEETETETETGFLDGWEGAGVAESVPNDAPAGDAPPTDGPPNAEGSGGGGPTGAPVDDALTDVFGPRVQSLPSFRTHAAAAKNLHAKAFTLGQHVTIGEGIDPTDVGDRVSMEVIGEEVAHALAGGGSGQHDVDRPGDPGEESAQASGEAFAPLHPPRWARSVAWTGLWWKGAHPPCDRRGRSGGVRPGQRPRQRQRPRRGLGS